jgi:hypothetical protein
MVVNRYVQTYSYILLFDRFNICAKPRFPFRRCCDDVLKKFSFGPRPWNNGFDIYIGSSTLSPLKY